MESSTQGKRPAGKTFPVFQNKRKTGDNMDGVNDYKLIVHETVLWRWKK